MELEGDSGPQEDERDKDSDTESLLEKITEKKEDSMGKQEEEDERGGQKTPRRSDQPDHCAGRHKRTTQHRQR
eukprot:5129638-Pyramimonas_sp.AAC.1